MKIDQMLADSSYSKVIFICLRGVCLTAGMQSKIFL